MLQTKIHGFSRRAGVLIGVFVIGALCAVAIPAASASTATTLHFFDKNLSSTFTDPSGHLIGNSNTPPPSGSAADSTAIGYVGNSAHHAGAPSASIHLACVVTTAPKAVCFAQVAIGGSMLLANQFTVSLASSNDNPFSTVKINGGIGKFAHARGTVQTAPAGKGSSNVTITYST
ncbi:MAG TPA: hypothetical protein VHM72_02890 [Solirubrobacteraceae bacterium]|jgi:hypothetical protein|nr:hypothetical protein [Solirubrobacteraceae bacterium]